MRKKAPLVSEVRYVQARTLVTKLRSDDNMFGTLYNMNLYRGCGHGCIYCDTRSSCYGIIDISRIAIKENAIQLLRQELSRKRAKGTIGTGSMNDPYMPLEAKEKLTREALQVLVQFGFPVHVVTKSALVLRDLDLLAALAQRHAVVTFSITTTDDKLARQLEPGASSPSRRLSAMRALSQSGVSTGAALMPLLPGITDGDAHISQVVQAVKEHGGSYVLPGCLTLRDTGREYFYTELSQLNPKALQLTKGLFGERYLPPRWYAQKVYQQVARAADACSLSLQAPRWKQKQPLEQMKLYSEPT